MWNHLKAKHENKLAEKKTDKEVKTISVTRPKQTMIASFAKGAVFSKDRKLACYLAAAEVTFCVFY